MFAGLSCLGSFAGTAVFEDVPPEGSGSGGYCGLARVLAPNSSGGVCPASFTVAVIIGCLSATPAPAKVTISSGATVNMICSGGTCVPTAAEAALNVADLTSLLASGNVEVKTTGSGVQANDIEVETGFGWSGANSLALDAYDSIRVEKKVSVAGSGGLSLLSNDGGSGGALSFGSKGNIAFTNLSSALVINGKTYTLVDDITTLAGDIAANPGGDYALVRDFDASGDGTYNLSPVPTTFTGAFEGLGHTVSNITILNLAANYSNVGGLFAEIGVGGTVSDVGLAEVNIACTKCDGIGGLIGLNYGLVFGDHATGSVEGDKGGQVGGLVGVNGYAGNGIIGVIDNSFATATVEETNTGKRALFVAAGGLAGVNGGNISQSFATGAVVGGSAASVGGLAGAHVNPGDQNFTISNSYATGPVSGQEKADVGGLAGTNDMYITSSFSTGQVKGRWNGAVGGSIGNNVSGENVADDYWDTKTSKDKNGVGEGNAAGVTGLTTKELLTGLPSGFDPTVWAENPKINGGLPYLIANPPEK